MRLLLILLTYFFFLLSNVYASIFTDFSSVNECIDGYKNFDDYKIKLKKCYQDKGIDFKDNLLDDLSDKKNLIEKSGFNYRNINSSENILKIKKYITKNPDKIYGITDDINSLYQKSLINLETKNNFLFQSYNSFSLENLELLKSNNFLKKIKEGFQKGDGVIDKTKNLYEVTKSQILTNSLGQNILVAAGTAATSAYVAEKAGIIKKDNKPIISLTLTIDKSSLAENSNDEVVITATSLTPVTQEITVSFSTAGDAVEGTDYQNIDDITFVAGETEASTTFKLIDDSVYEGNETINIQLDTGLSQGSFILLNDLSFTITENESAPTVTLATSAASIAEDAGSSLTLTATISQVADENVVVTLATAGTSTNGTDYSSLSTITVTAGQLTGTTSFTPTDDSVYENDETAIISIDSVSGADATESGAQSVTITVLADADATPIVTLATSNTSIAEDAGSSLTLTATLSVPTYQNVTVALGTAGTGTEGTDYGVISDITVLAGQTTGTASFTPTDDSTYEGDETAVVSITSVSGGSANESGTPQEVTITVTEDDDPPSFSIDDVTTADESAANATFTVTLTPASGLTALVDYATSNGTATAGSDYVASSGTILFGVGETSKTFTVPVLSDTTDENNETVTLTLSNAVRATIGDNTGILTITDDDNPPALSIDDVITADESAANATFTVSLSAASGKDITVNYATSNGTATAGSDYTATSGTLTISAGATSATFNVPVLADTTDEDDETVTLTLSNPSNATISDATGVLTITDDDNPPALSIDDVTTADESAANAQFTVSLSAASGKDITVNYATSNGTATAGSDYTATSGTLTISAGATSATFNVPVLADTTDEDDETVTLTLSNPSNATISDATGVLTITDDDTSSFSVDDVSVAENGVSATITVSASNAFSSDVTIDYATSNGTATAGSDYTAASGTLTFSAGDTSKEFTVSITNDTTDENNETVTITISNASNGVIGDATGVLTITDDDNPPALSIDDVTTADESAANAQFTVSLSAASGKDITVNYATSNTTATAGSDYTATSGTLTISAGATSATFNVPVLADTTDEDDETVTLTLSNPSNATISDATGVLTITDDDNPPALSVNDISADEDGTSGTFTVSLSAVSGKDISVNYTTSNGTATAGSDYTAASGTLTISAGNSSGSISVSITNDSTFEGDETVTLTLLDPATNATISDDTGILTIVEDDPGPTLSINDVTTADESAANATFTVTLTPASGLTALVDYATSNGTATAGSDYVASSGTILFGVGETSKTFTVPVLSDTTDENNETVTLTLSNAVRATIGDNTGILTITDDDNPPALSIDDVITADESAANATFTVSLSAASGKDITVNYATSNGTATAGSDYTATSGTLTISAGATSATFNVPVLADTTDEDDETVTLTLSNPSNATISDATGVLTITDDDNPPALSIDDVTTADESAANAQFTVSLSAASGKDITVNYATSNGTATTADGDYTATSGTLTISAGATSATFNVPVLADTTDEDDETVTLTLSNPSNATISDATGVLTITDDDNPPALSIDDVTTADESAANAQFTVSLSAASGKDITVNYATSNGTATAGSDYTATSGTLTISAGATSATFNVPVLADTTDEDDETVTLTLSNPSNATISDATGVLTITDDDTSSFSVDDVSVAENGVSATITVSASNAFSSDVTIDYATSNGTATAGSDYTAASGTLTFSAGDTSKEFTVSITNDTTDENNETVTITISNASNGVIGDATGVLTITDDDNPPALSIDDVTTADESAANAQFTVSLSAASGKDITVDYATSNGTATAGSDYTATSGTLTISAGATSATFNVPVLADTTDEDDETVTLTLSNPSNATISDATGVLTITDDDTSSFSVDDVSVAENGVSATITVSASNAFSSDVTIDYATSNGTATAGSDYTAASGTLTFSAGDTSKEFTVSITNDTTDENNETVTITISNASNGVIGDATGVLTITDDDNPPALSIDDVTTADESAANAQFTVSLSAASGKDITVDYATSNTTATAGSDYTATSGTLTISAGATSATFNVPVLADTTDEDDETVTLTLSNPSNATISDATGVLTITDDDNPPALSVNDISADEDGTSGTFTVSLSAVSGKDISVNYTTSNGTATAGSDYTAASGTLTISAGNSSGSISVSITNDSTFEGDETVTLTLLDPATNATISDDTGILTIVEDDPGPTLSINDVTTADESAANATFTVTLTPASGLTALVDYATSNGTATAGSDYVASSGTILFGVGETSKTFTVPVLSDTTDENNETVTLTLSNAVRATIGDNTGILTITDDDNPPALSIDDVITADESAANATFTVSLSAASGKDITVNYATSNGTATAGSDYTATSGTLTISAGATSATFNVPVLADTTDEDDETVTLTLSNPSNATISDATGVLTITDDDNPPALSIDDVTTADESAANAQFTVSLSAASGKDITVNYATSNGTATAGSDYTATSGTLTISAGATSATFNVPVLADTTDEDDETVTLTLSNPSNATISDATGVLTITDDDTSSFSVDDVSVAENGVSATITVSASNAFSSDVTIDYATSNGTATAGSDYTAASGTLTFSAGDTSKEFTVSITNDTTDENNETVTITISNASNGVIGDATGVLTITDDDNPPALSIDDVTTADESAANAQFTVSLSAASGKDITVNYATSNTTATAGSDYTATSGTLTISAGATSATFNVPVLADTTDEDDETVTLTLSNPSNATISDATGVLTITDDDNPPALSIDDVTTADESAANAQFTVSLSAASGKDITVNYATSNGTATAGSDYTATSGTLTISAGATSATFNVPVLADTTDEDDETVTLTLSNPSNATISDATGVLTITDDDTSSFSVDDVSVAEDGVSATITVSASNAFSSDVTIDYATSNGTATAGSDYTAASGTLTFSAGDTSKEFTVSITNDTTDENNETVTITISNASNGVIGDATGVLTITDDDTSSFSVDDVSVAEDGVSATITVSASNAFSSDVTIDYATSNGTATAGSDYTAASGTLTFSAGDTSKEFTVSITNDTTDENNETVTITISNASNGVIGDATGVLTITDDDNPPALSIDDVTTADESAANAQFTVSLSAASGKDITVNYATSNGTATAGSDYTATSGTLTISAGATSATFNVPVLADTTDEDDETVTLTLSNPSNATISDATGVLTITDDDTSSFSVDDVSVAENGVSATITVSASNAFSSDVTIDYATSNGTATAGSDYTAASGTLTFSAGDTSKEFTVSITNDTTDENNETVTITISNASNGVIGDATGVLTITDDDNPPALSIDDVTTADESAANAQFTVSLSAASGKDITVNYATSNGTATAGSDYTATSGTLTISAGATSATFNVPVLADTTDEDDETVTLTLSNPSNATISDATGVLTITDDDNPPALSIDDVTTADESAANAQFTVSLSAASGKDITVNYATSNTTATAGSDYTATSGTLTISAGATSATFNVPVLADTTDEDDETVTLTLSNPSNATISDATGVLTITDDDTSSFSVDDVSVAENGVSATITVSASNAFSSDVTIDYATSNGTATAGSDYTAASGTLTFSAGDTSKEFTVSITNDTTDENNETVTITISNASNGVIGDATGVLTITDDDNPPALSIDDVTTADESAANAQFTVSLSAASGKDITVNYATSNGTATAGSDYTAASGTLTISAGATSATFNVPVLADTTDEDDETVTLTLSNPSNATISDATGVLTITDDDTSSFSVDDVSVAEDGVSATITVSASNAFSSDVTIDYATSNGTATAGSDYTAASGTLTFSAGDTSKEFTVSITNDTTDENNETVTITISNASNGVIGDATGVLTITDDDNPPALSIDDVTTADESAANAQFTVSLSAASGKDITVNYATSNTTATAGSDYTATSGTLTISAGATSATFNVPVLADTTDEDDETVTLTLSNPSNATISDATGVLTITDDDTSSFSVDDVSVAENGVSATITVSASNAFSSDVTIDYATSNGTATAGSDYTAASGTLTFSAGDTSKEFTVSITNDSTYENNETVTITISNASNGVIGDATGVLTIIADGDGAPTVTLTTSAASIAENAGTSLTLTATLSNATNENVTVALVTAGTGTEGTDYSNISDITITAGQTTGTTLFTPTNDSIYELNETAIISIDTVSGGSATENGTQSVTLTITNDESAPTVSLSSSASTIAEKGGGLITITATASGATYQNISVPISTSGTATEGTDYGVISDITITAGTTTGTATLTPINDTVYENSETAIIDITVSGGGASENGTQRLTLTITDKALDSGTQNSYNSGTATAWLSETEFSNSGFNDNAFVGSSGGDDPYVNINLHKALAYSNGSGLMLGAGQVVAVMDSGFQVNGAGSNTSTHVEFFGKTITAHTNSNFTTYNWSSNNHGTGVAAIAVGNYGAGVTMGVAPEADLHIHDFAYDFQPTAWATGTADAEADGAIVQNNSWGFDQQYGAADLDVVLAYKSNNGLTGGATLVYYQGVDTNGDGVYDVGSSTSQKTWTEANWNTYVSALNSFQDTGVVVFALSNDDSKGDADLSAGLPELFPELKEAWINVANVDIEGTGAMSGKTYTLKSAPCGSTAQYCLAADGFAITTAGGPDYIVNVGGTNYDYQTTAGSSFSAPQVSGAIALLANHFPNHSPEQLTDRLLASAYNDWSGFGVDGTVTFGNGVVHGYSTDYGHGIMDIYAALQPITSNMLGRSIYTTNSNLSNSGQLQSAGRSLDTSYLRSSRSFGDAIKNALSSKVNYFYDALNGGFAYKMDGHVIPQSNTKPVINLETEMNRMTSASTLNNYLNIGKTDYKNILYKKSFSDDEDLEKQLAITFGNSALPVQSFFNFEQMALNGITSYNLPFLDQEDRGLSLNTLIEGEKFKFSLSSTTPIKKSDGEEATYFGSTTSLLSTIEYSFNEDLVLGLLSGFVEEREGFLGLEGNEAFTLDNSSNLSKFNSLKIQKNIKDDLALTLTGTLAYSDFEGDSTSLLKSADNILSESYSLTLNKANLFGNDNFAISISQPNRVRDGSLTLRLSDLADKDGNINIRETEVDLEPSGRQIDTSLGYTKDITEDFSLSFKATMTDEFNHIKDNDKNYSGFIGLNFKDLKIGVSDSTNISKPSFRLKYRKQF